MSEKVLEVQPDGSQRLTSVEVKAKKEVKEEKKSKGGKKWNQ